jgi:hypothetical protein
VVRKPTGTLVTACALSAALLVAGCGGDGDKDTKPNGELFLQPVAAQGPDPFTDSTATLTATPSPVTRTSEPDRSEPDRSGSSAVRSVSGGTPGLYGGTQLVGSCDVDRQIDQLTRDQGKARAFAHVAGISQASIPDYLRGLAPVVLRADTRVTGHGYVAGRVTGYQAVLQAGTAVLVDNRGVPRVRCACGNPLRPAVAMQGSPGTRGRPWAGYRHAQVIVVAPTAQVITNITIINVVNNTWIERRIGHDVRHDRVVPAPDPVTPPVPTLTPSLGKSASSASASQDSTSPSEESSSAEANDCVTPTVTVAPGTTDDVWTDEPTDAATGTDTDADTDTSMGEATDCPTATVTATPPATEPSDDTSVPDLGTTIPDEPTVDEPSIDEPSVEEPSVEAPGTSLDSTDEIGPETVPDTPDLPDGGGLIPDDPAGTDSVFGSPTDVFGN